MKILGTLLVLLLTLSLSAQNIDNANVKSTDASRGVGAAIASQTDDPRALDLIDQILLK